MEEHIKHFEIVFEGLLHFALKINADKCIFAINKKSHSSDMELLRQDYSPSLKKLLLCETFLNRNHFDSFGD